MRCILMQFHTFYWSEKPKQTSLNCKSQKKRAAADVQFPLTARACRAS